MARPRKEPDERRDARLPAARLTLDERVFVDAQAAAAGLSTAEYVRRRVLGVRVDPAPAAADEKLLLELNRIGNNMNQIARNLNSERPVHRLDIDQTFNQLQNVMVNLSERVTK
jgi:anion-transporting  ArsA/GET3 family ATPase